MILKPLGCIAAIALLPLYVHGAEATPPAAPLPHAHLYENLEEKLTPQGLELIPGVLQAGMLLEVQAYYAEQGGTNSSDLKLATFELGLDGELNENVKGHALLLWEQDETEPLDLDEGFVTLGGSEQIPLSLTAGRLYLPFGAYYNHCISDPLTQALGEIRKTAALLGYACELCDIQAGVFRRDLAGEDQERLNRFAASLTLNPADFLQLGGYLVSDLGETDGLQDGIKANTSPTDSAAMPAEHDPVPGAGGFIHLARGIFALEGEYIAAAKKFAPGVLADERLQPAAWNIELACMIRPYLEIAGRYEGSRDFPDVPRHQCGGAVTCSICRNTTLAVEYLYARFSGNLPDRHLTTTQLALEF